MDFSYESPNHWLDDMSQPEVDGGYGGPFVYQPSEGSTIFGFQGAVNFDGALTVDSMNYFEGDMASTWAQ